MKNKIEKAEQEFTKFSTKKSTTNDVSTAAAIGKELGKMKSNLTEVNSNFGVALEALNSKKTLKFAKVLQETIEAQEAFYLSAHNSFDELHPYIEKMQTGISEDPERESDLYMEGFLRKLKTSKQGTGKLAFSKAWFETNQTTPFHYFSSPCWQ